MEAGRDHPLGNDPEGARGWGYFVNEFQTVTADDARALAEALERALDGEKNELQGEYRAAVAELIEFVQGDEFCIA